MFPRCPIMSQRHHDGHGNSDAGSHFHLPAYVVPLEMASLGESSKNSIQRGALIATLFPGSGVVLRGGEDVTVFVELDKHHAAVVEELSAVLLVTFPIAFAIQPVDCSRTSVFQGHSIFFNSTERDFPQFVDLRTYTTHLTALGMHN